MGAYPTVYRTREVEIENPKSTGGCLQMLSKKPSVKNICQVVKISLTLIQYVQIAPKIRVSKSPEVWIVNRSQNPQVGKASQLMGAYPTVCQPAE